MTLPTTRENNLGIWIQVPVWRLLTAAFASLMSNPDSEYVIYGKELLKWFVDQSYSLCVWCPHICLRYWSCSAGPEGNLLLHPFWAECGCRFSLLATKYFVWNEPDLQHLLCLLDWILCGLDTRILSRTILIFWHMVPKDGMSCLSLEF